jgi:hypothetical protein
MKYINKMTACRRLPLACALICTLALASCGGGGGGGDATATPATVRSSTVLEGFFRMMPDLSFLWTTSQQREVEITLRRADTSAALGDLSVVISKYICDDPTGGGQLPHPVHLDNYLLYSLTVDEQITTSAILNLGQLQLQLPAATSHVLVEALDNNDPSLELYSKLVAPAELAGLQIVIPSPRLRDENGEPLSSSPSPLASCN